MKKRPFLIEFFPVISPDSNDGVFIEMFALEKLEEPLHQRIYVGNRIAIAVFHRLDFLLGVVESFDGGCVGRDEARD